MNTLFLDYNSSKALLFYMCYHNDIKRPQYLNDDDIAYYFSFRDENGYFKTKLCYDNREQKVFLTHFERLDCLYSLLTLYDRIYISPIYRENYREMYGFDEDQLSELGISYYDTEKLPYPSESIIKDTISLMKMYKNEIRALLFNDNASRYAEIISSEEYERYFEIKAYKDLFKGQLLHGLENNSNIPWRNSRSLWDVTETNGFYYLDNYFSSIYNALSTPNSIFYSSLLTLPSIKRIDSKACNELDQYVLHADFSQGLHIVPTPKDYHDIIKCRKNPDLQSFRDVFSHWINYFIMGDYDSLMKINQDVIIANKKLCSLEKIERATNSPLYKLSMHVLGYLIPGLSYALDGLDVIYSFAASHIELKNRWVKLPPFNSSIAQYYHPNDN